jgi:hypothetical protein
VEAENAWRVTRGTPTSVIAYSTVVVAINHDDLREHLDEPR